MLEKHSYRINEYEFRTCDANLLQKGALVKAEIVKWGYDSCWTINMFNKDYDGFFAIEIGDRMFNCISDLDYQEVFKYARNYLDGIESN
jgi:hypothetical protein